jgi:alkaline phosphatase D
MRSGAQPSAVPLRWEVAQTRPFRTIVAKGSAVATPELAHSVRVNVTGLQPGRWYWYRFMLGDAVSPVGRTRTAPAAGSMPDR